MHFCKAALVISLFSLSACIETTGPLCDSSNMADLAGLDRTYTFSILGSPDQPPSQQTFTISHSGLGVYDFESTPSTPRQSARLCHIGSWTVAEFPTQFGTYQQSILSLAGLVSLGLNQLIVDRDDLTAGGVSFTMVDRPVSSTMQKLVSLLNLKPLNKTTTKVMVIDVNTAHDRAVIGASARPFGLGLTFY